MKKSAFISLVFLISFSAVSCSSSHSSNDSDTISDTDSNSDDIETVDDDSDSQDSEIVDDSDVKPDADQDADQDADSDTSEKVECLDLRYNENTIKTPFPFKDANGKPTFCRPGCDIPTENDPQCVRNIWEWDNWDEYQAYLNAEKEIPGQYSKRECYPWPCKLPDMKSDTDSGLRSICDRNVTVNRYTASMGTVWTHGLSGGLAVMDLSNSAARTLVYDPEKDEYVAVAQSIGGMGFNKNRFIIGVFDSYPLENTNHKSYVISVLKKGDEYFYEFI